MRLAKPLCFGFMIAAAIACPAHPQDVDQSLQLYAVHVVRVPKEDWTGQGVYLGSGLVLTAGHVAGEFWRTIRIDFAGQELPTEVLKRGSFSAVDLALVSIDDSKLPVSLRLRRLPVCKHAPWPGEQVIIVTVEGIARSRVVSPGVLPRDLAARSLAAIADVATTGNSGSGVFDANQKCLMGIISGKVQQTQIGQENGHTITKKRDVAKFFVPAPTIADFIPPEYHF